MGELIEHADEGENVVRVNGERGESMVPLKVYQDVYHQVTGRTRKSASGTPKIFWYHLMKFSNFITK